MNTFQKVLNQLSKAQKVARKNRTNNTKSRVRYY